MRRNGAVLQWDVCYHVTDCTAAVGEVPTAQCVLTAVLTAVCAYRLLYLQRSVHIDPCTYSGLCISTAVLTAVCVYRLLYLQRSVHIDWCTYNGLCISTAVLTAVCAYRLLYLQRSVHIDRIALCTGCPTRYRTRHFFNNFTTNKDIATKFEADLPHCLRNVKERTHCCSNFVAIS